MTYKKWEKELLKVLKPLPKEERLAVIEYYKELYGDKLEAGITDEEIVKEFGSPSVCAERILSENGLCLSANRAKGNSIGWWIAICILTPILILPVYVSLFSIILSFGAVTLSVGTSTLAGALYVVYSPFLAIEGLRFFDVISHMGIGFAVIGVCSLLTMAFGYLTKHTFKWTIKSLAYIYHRR